ncbi:hypothetical protein [uncultured Desulfobacter sp.]|uniref:hypothetical protein n=1 Tax=uncultured Desulfobacter sp. TaxID=240139 RepID=UPI002AA8D2C5|nr:hypothetical protein [uncultured Desulfobacter sp.]
MNIWLARQPDITIVTTNTVSLEGDSIQLLVFYRTATPAPSVVPPRTRSTSSATIGRPLAPWERG